MNIKDLFPIGATDMRVKILLTLSLILSTGIVIAQGIDFEAARRAAENGDSEAQLFLGLAHDLGKDLPKDNALAVYWYQKAAEQGNPEAQSILGFSYKAGKIVPRNSAKSFMWHQKAAQQGNINSQAALAGIYYFGEGVPKNYVLAYAWSNIAASLGHTDAPKFRDELEKYMTPEQISDAQKMSTNWSHGKPIQ